MFLFFLSAPFKIPWALELRNSLSVILYISFTRCQPLLTVSYPVHKILAADVFSPVQEKLACLTWKMCFLHAFSPPSVACVATFSAMGCFEGDGVSYRVWEIPGKTLLNTSARTKPIFFFLRCFVSSEYFFKKKHQKRGPSINSIDSGVFFPFILWWRRVDYKTISSLQWTSESQRLVPSAVVYCKLGEASHFISASLSAGRWDLIE